MKIGYTSAFIEDNIDIQVKALEQEGCGYIYHENKTDKAQTERKKMLKTLRRGDTVVVWQLQCLTRKSLSDLMVFFHHLFNENINLKIIRDNIDTSSNPEVMMQFFTLFYTLQKDIISLRTRESLADKKNTGFALGKPKGTIQKSKFDNDVERIRELLELGLSVKKIAIHLGYKQHLALNTYINKRKLRPNRPLK